MNVRMVIEWWRERTTNGNLTLIFTDCRWVLSDCTDVTWSNISSDALELKALELIDHLENEERQGGEL